MKKSMLYTGTVYAICGFAFLLFGLFGPEVSFEGLVWGLAGAGIGPGIMMVGKYFYWSKPENAPIYEKKIREEKIELSDERRIMLRDKSGRITYLIIEGVLVFLIFLLSVLDVFSLVEINKYIIISLCGLLLFQFISGIAVYRYLDKRL